MDFSKAMFVVAAWTFGLSLAAGQTTLYVDDTAGGANDGSSWSDAFVELQSALAVAAAGSGDEIWVAEGTYKPSKETDPGDPRSATFQLINGVKIYGGFPDGGGPWASRHTEANETILSGDIGTGGDHSDNSYHVVRGNGTSFAAVLDGFRITGGNADADSVADQGGGMYNYAGSPTVANCTFLQNAALSGGGGITNSNYASPTVTNCAFRGNSASSGGGMYNAFDSNPRVTNCTFRENSATEGGGGMYNDSASTPRITNCIFWANMDSGGPDQWSAQIYNDGSTPAITYCCIEDSDPDAGPVYPGTGNIDDDPLFVSGSGGDVYLSQVAAEQGSDSACVNAGSGLAEDYFLSGTTRTDQVGDSDVVDMGYHYNASVILPTSPDPNRSQYGGWKGISATATGFFRIEEIDGRWWLIDPDGYGFISKGVSHISYTADYCPALGYSEYALATEAKYGSIEAFAQAAVQRLWGWGFNTVGAWSNAETRQQGMPYTAKLDVASSAGASWLYGTFPDVFSDEFQTIAEAQAATVCAGRTNDPYLVGYFLDNELYWGPDWRGAHTLLEEFLSLAADAAGKIATVDFLVDRYGDVGALNAAWGSAYGSWDQLLQSTTPPTLNAAVLVDAADFLTIVTQRYFQVCNDALRMYDQNHLNLGCRFVGPVPDEVMALYGLPPELIAIINAFWWDAGGATRLFEGTVGGVDVVSINIYEGDQIYDFAPSDNLMWNIYGIIGAPVLISEFGFKAMDSGLPNTIGAGVPLETQADRAAAFTNYVKSLVDLPFGVGYHWFEHADEPALGRFDGENCNFGLVDINDDPWDVLVTQMTAVNEAIEARRAIFSNVSRILHVIKVKREDHGTVMIYPDLLEDPNNDPNDPTEVREYTNGTEVVLVAYPNPDRDWKKWKIWEDPNHYPDPNYRLTDTNTVLYLTMDKDYVVEGIFKCSAGIEQVLPLLFVGVVLCGLGSRRLRGRRC